jgi:hypothetical protein
MNLIQACDDPHLFKRWFRKPETWSAWRVFLRVLFAIPGLLTPEQWELYRQCTGRTDVPSQPASEAVLIVGRRGGKSFIMALLAVFLACFRDYRQYLQPGERAAVLVIAADRKQARVILRYCRGMLTNIPMLRRMIEREQAESFELNNSTVIEVATASFRAVRGYTVCAVLADEVSFWRSDEDSANPDVEIINAVRAATVTIPNALMVIASSPYARRGVLWDSHRRYFGKPDSPVLVWKAPTRVMNPSVPQRLIDEATERDPAAAAAEFLAEFRNDVASFVDRETVLACTDTGERERPFRAGLRYAAFVDPSGGSVDSMTLSIGHRESDKIIVDVVREIPAPFDPESATEEFVRLLKSYGLRRVTGDRYAGMWCQQAFNKRGVHYIPSDLPKSALYTDLLPKLNARTIRLVDNVRLVNQIAALERRTARGGRDSIDHPPSGKDDVANAVAGVAAVVINRHSSSCEPLRI